MARSEMSDRPLNGVQTDATSAPEIGHHPEVSAPRPVRVLSGDPGLREQLRARLETVLGRPVTTLQALEQSVPTDIVVTTTTECSPDECAGLAETGAVVIVLAALPSSFQEQSYRNAGAAEYLAMSIDVGPLAGAVQSLA